ncbi:MAG: nicotinamide riboside transporter PnuC [Fimbriimonadaceae bacterium]
MKKTRPQFALVASVLLVCLVSIGALMTGRSSYLEAFGFITGVACVYLAAREHIANWPIGLLNSGAYVFIFFRDKLFADAGLQVVYVVLGVLGWYWWLKGGQDRTEAKIAATPLSQWLPIGLIAIVSTILMTKYLASIGDAAPFLDALTTVTSLVAQYLLTRKYIENWIVWILVDVIYVPLYLWKGLYLTGVLYAIFTIIAYLGLMEWNRLRSREIQSVPAHSFVKGLVGIGALASLVMGWICYRFESNAEFASILRQGVSARLEPQGGNPFILAEADFGAFKLQALDPISYVREFGRKTGAIHRGTAYILDGEGKELGTIRYQDDFGWEKILCEAKPAP